MADDILHAIDSSRAVVLLMLDLSAAFDTVYHKILLKIGCLNVMVFRVRTRMVCILPVISYTICSN